MDFNRTVKITTGMALCTEEHKKDNIWRVVMDVIYEFFRDEVINNPNIWDDLKNAPMDIKVPVVSSVVANGCSSLGDWRLFKPLLGSPELPSIFKIMALPSGVEINDALYDEICEMDKGISFDCNKEYMAHIDMILSLRILENKTTDSKTIREAYTTVYPLDINADYVAPEFPIDTCISCAGFTVKSKTLSRMQYNDTDGSNLLRYNEYSGRYHNSAHIRQMDFDLSTSNCDNLLSKDCKAPSLAFVLSLQRAMWQITPNASRKAMLLYAENALTALYSLHPNVWSAGHLREHIAESPYCVDIAIHAAKYMQANKWHPGFIDSVHVLYWVTNNFRGDSYVNSAPVKVKTLKDLLKFANAVLKMDDLDQILDTCRALHQLPMDIEGNMPTDVVHNADILFTSIDNKCSELYAKTLEYEKEPAVNTGEQIPPLLRAIFDTHFLTVMRNINANVAEYSTWIDTASIIFNYINDGTKDDQLIANLINKHICLQYLFISSVKVIGAHASDTLYAYPNMVVKKPKRKYKRNHDDSLLLSVINKCSDLAAQTVGYLKHNEPLSNKVIISDFITKTYPIGLDYCKYPHRLEKNDRVPELPSTRVESVCENIFNNAVDFLGAANMTSAQQINTAFKQVSTAYNILAKCHNNIDPAAKYELMPEFDALNFFKQSLRYAALFGVSKNNINRLVFCSVTDEFISDYILSMPADDTKVVLPMIVGLMHRVYAGLVRDNDILLRLDNFIRIR